MPKFSDTVPGVEQVTLGALLLHYREVLLRHGFDAVAGNLEVWLERELGPDFGAERIALRLRTHVYETLPGEVEKLDALEVPATWWDHFKQQARESRSSVLRAFAGMLHPPRMRTVYRKHVTRRVCPHLNVAHKGDRLHFAYLAEGILPELRCTCLPHYAKRAVSHLLVNPECLVHSQPARVEEFRRPMSHAQRIRSEEAGLGSIDPANLISGPRPRLTMDSDDPERLREAEED